MTATPRTRGFDNTRIGLIVGALAGVLAGEPATARAAEQDAAELRDLGRHPVPTFVWALTQLVPSPEVLFSKSDAAFGLRWQVTPVLYSFGIHRRLSPWRFFIAEPNVRHGGSIEVFASPEYLALASADDRLGLRVGTRTYFPVHQQGEYVSVSLGSSYFYFDGHGSMAIEGGAYVLFGMIGVVVTVSPTLAGGSSIATLRLRYF